MAIDLLVSGNEPEVCEVTYRGGERCILKAGHDGRHKDQYGNEWDHTAIGSSDHDVIRG